MNKLRWIGLKGIRVPLLLLVIVILLVIYGKSFMSYGNTSGKSVIVFGDSSWDSIQLNNRIAGFIIKYGYGYQVDYTFAEVVPLLYGISRGNIDVISEFWVDNNLKVYQQLMDERKIKDLGVTFPDAPQGWYVPTYVIKGDPARGIKPMAPDLKSVTDLPKYWRLFKDPDMPDKGRFYNSPSGWICTDINETKIRTYGLDGKFAAFDTGSETSLNSSLLSAYQRGKPWLGYYWEPTWIMGKLKMTKLEEPPYKPADWGNNYDCAYPNCRVHLIVNQRLDQKAPQVFQFLGHYNTTLKAVNSSLSYMHDHGGDSEKAAVWYLKQYPEQWHKWVPANVAANVEKALKEVK